jgi:acetyltransferase-like isoleucine patch superfamily enzyme
MKKAKYLIFDVFYIIFAGLVYSLAISTALYIGQLIWNESIPSKVGAILIGYFTFLNSFVIIVGITKRIFQPKLVEGEFKIGFNKEYTGWILNSLFSCLLLCSPFAKQVHVLFYLNWIYYRLMGMKVPINTLIGMDTTIRQPELIEIGENSIIGLGAIMSCHFTANGKIHTQKGIKVGSKSVIGGYAGLSPGVIVGDNSVVGAKSSVFPNVTIGNGVRIGSECSIFMGTIIPDNVKIKSHSLVTKECNIQEGEVWGGNPAVKIS